MNKAKFVQTEIGLIPDDWEVKRLGELFEMRAGGDVNKQHFSYYKSDKYKYKIFSNGLENEGVYGFTDLPRYKGDSITITGRGTVGVSMYRKGDFDAVIRLLVLESRNKNQTNNFFISELINEVVKFPNESTGVPQLTVPQIKDVLIPLPPLPEQQRIAKALSDVDALISTTEKLIQKKKNVKQGTMQNLLTGKKRLPGFAKSTRTKMTELGEIPEDWEVKNLGSITQNCSYGVGAEAISFNGRTKYIRITDIDDNSHSFMPSPLTSPAFYENKHVVQENDLLIARTGASVGKTYLYDSKDGKLIFAGFLIKMNICEANSKFVFYSTLTKYYQDWIVSESARTGQPGVNLQQMKKLQIALPTTIEEQTAIANVLSSMDKEIETLNTKVEKYRNLKTAMMQQLLTGKIRLV